MFDVGWQEFAVIALVAVVVVGPKDLPKVIRTVGQWIRKARSLAAEFQGSLEEMAREAELDDVRKQIQDVSKDGIGASIERHVDPTGELRQTFEDARSSTGADEIESALDETRREVRAAADGAGPDGGSRGDLSFEELAELSKIPDNSVKPPVPATPAAAAPKAATAATSAASPAAAPAATPASSTPAEPKPTAKRAAKAAPAGPAARKPAARAAKADPAGEGEAKPKRTRRKPAATDGEA